MHTKHTSTCKVEKVFGGLTGSGAVNPTGKGQQVEAVTPGAEPRGIDGSHGCRKEAEETSLGPGVSVTSKAFPQGA